MQAHEILLARLDQRLEQAKAREKLWADRLVAAAKNGDDEELSTVTDLWLKANAALNHANEQRQKYVDNRTLGLSIQAKSKPGSRTGCAP